ncbi:TaqI-like C-terminal specificity domain-containing protein [uncultured Brachyspira sp.]|uniref:type IIG restriction enzyme/methyltransferase n=1 Tax=uncultured Brachyspira sp. TaxID=221953 RepID=UPI00262EEC4F|nr:TaqI-like C-terminal specificity domain-containing protein [uncultured Brachyspira sp.]
MKSITKNAKELLKLRNLLNYEIDNDKLDFFKRDIKWYRNQINNAKDKGETEEHCKGILNKFLVNAFGYDSNTKGKIDLVIKFDDNIKTIIETKNYNNEEEMIKDNDYFYKGFYQTILYYYKSRKNKDNKDFNIDNIIITNFEKVYLFSKYDFEKLINDNQIVNYFNENSKVKNETFYKICGGFLENINLEVIGYKIDLFNDDETLIYRFFNSYNICSVKLGNDINSISNTFYKEIIYMMGLEEDKEKKLRLSNVHNSLIRLTMDVIRNSSDKANENEIFDEALKLNIIWVNRILFLKILEAQLRTFRNDKHLDILNPFKIKDYNYLYTLFFNVLAKPKNMRSSSNDYNYIPYLNSSLFEEGKDELIFSITKLNNDSRMKVMSGSILYNDRDFNSSQLTFLEYILRFLNCYVFNADAKNADKNTIIKSSVLGLVFERLNGYKDGSHFTPPAITMYMSRYSIEKIIIEKFNKYFTDTHFNNIEEVKNYVRANIHIYRDNIKDILNSIKIIDPACGSGHFLVACLNELIRIKSEFRVLHDNIDVNISEDELVINYIDGTHFKYNIENDSITERKQEIEKTLFEAKEHIISNQLYGVDINPNSVNICRLRLWIELLKSSYYTDIKSDEKFIDLEILPNLEFKIVSANSLIELDDKEVNLISLTWDKNELIKNMREYFNASYENKNGIRKEILRLIKEYSNHNAKLENYNPFDMLKSYDFFDSGLMFGVDKFDLVIMNPPYFQLTGNHQYLDYFDKKDSKVADIYQLFMEMTFNKLIDDIGIVSAVISNKWMRAGYGERTRKFLYDRAYVYEVIDLGANWFESATVDTNIISYGKRKADIQEKINAYKISLCDDIISSKKDKLSGVEKECFIYPKKDNSSWIILNEDENSILNKISKYKSLKDYGIEINRGITTGFNDAFIIDEETKDRLIKEDKKSAEVIKPLLRGRDIKRYCYDYNNLYLLFIPWHFPLNKDNTIIGASLKAEEEFKNNYKAIYNHLLNFKEQLQKRNKAETGIRYEWYALQRCAASYYEDFEKDKIIYQEICQEASYALDECKSFIGNTGYIMTSKKYNLKVLLSLLNSKLYWWFFKNNNVILGDSAIRMLGMYIEVLPIIEVDEKIEKDIIQLVDKIIIAKKENKDTSEIEGEVDKIVYSLYGLSEEEIRIIEG